MADSDETLYDHPGTKRSRVWQFFGFKRVPDTCPPKLDMEHVWCKKCGSKYKFNKNTTNMQFHLDHQHRGLITEQEAGPGKNLQQAHIPALFNRQTRTDTTRPLTAEKKRQIDDKLADLMIDSLLPFSFVESEKFKLYSAELDERYTPPGRKGIVKKIDGKYDKMRVVLLRDLQTCSSRVSITHDAWTSINTESYDTTTVHYINSGWELKSAVLETKLFPGSHTGENIATHLQTTLNTWGIKDPVCVTDNAANERKAFKLMNLTRVGCYGHKINLIVKNSLNIPEINRILAKGRSIVTFFHQSSLASDVLQQKQNLLLEGNAQGHKLIQDVPTRWNSSLDMLKRLLEQTAALQATLMDKSLTKRASDLQKNLFIFEDTVMVGHLVSVLEGFKTSTEMLSPEKTPSQHLIIPVMKKLFQEIKVQEDDINIVKKVKKEMQKQLEERFGPEIEIAFLASLLHPKTKKLTFLSEGEREKAHGLLLNETMKLFKDVGSVVIQKEKDVDSQDEKVNKILNKKKRKKKDENVVPPLHELPEVPARVGWHICF